MRWCKIVHIVYCVMLFLDFTCTCRKKPHRKHLDRWVLQEKILKGGWIVSQIALAIWGLAKNDLIGAFQEAWACENLDLKPP